MPFRFRRPSSRSSEQSTSAFTWVILFRWIVCFSMPASGAITIANRTHLRSDTSTCSAFNMRIYGGETSHDGAILIQDSSGIWRRLCFGTTVDILFLNGHEGARRVAEVVCRQAGYLESNASVVFYKYNSEKLRKYYTDFLFYFPLKCGGYEERLSECHPYNMEFKGQDLSESFQIREECYYGVACQDDNHFAVTLDPDEWTQSVVASMNSTGYARASGLLNATAYGWVGHVCASFFNAENRARIAQISCRQMGYRSGFAIRTVIPNSEDSGTPFATGNGFLPNKACIMPDTKCKGQEKSIADCDHNNAWGTFTPDLMFDSKWPGYPIPIGCTNITDDTFEISTSKNLNTNTSAPDAVYIRHGSMWLPVVNSSSAYTCAAVCKSLNRHKKVKAICYLTVIEDRALSQSGGYAASIYCQQNETDLESCAHHIELLNEDIMTSQSNELIPHQLHALCEDQQYQSFIVDLKVTTDLRVTHSGCIVIDINGTLSFVMADGNNDKKIIAATTCKKFQTGRNLTAAFATSGNYEFNDNGQESFSKTFACPEPSVVIGCSYNDRSAKDCTYFLKDKDPRLTWPFGAGLLVFCAYGALELHLSANFSAYDGRLEFRFQNGRAFVDVDGWNAASAAVACRQLGFGNESSQGIKKLLAHRGMEWVMTKIKCDGHEDSLTACSHEWKAIQARFGVRVAGVVCKDNVTHFSTGLINGDSNSGLVAIRRNSDIIYICADSNPDDSPRHRLFHGQVGILLCRNAGFTRVKNAERLNFDGADRLPNLTLAFKNFVCKDENSLLVECSHDGIVEISSCSNEDAITQMVQQKVLALRCDEYEFGSMVRLVGGRTPFEGHVEVLYKGQWGAICDDRFDIDASTVICRQIFGPKSKGRPVHGSKYSTKNEVFHLDEVQCLSDAETLAQCTHNEWGDHDCGPCEQAGVVCQGEQFIHQPTVAFTSNGEKQQLVCSADGVPLPSYQWLIAGVLMQVSGDSVEVLCNGSGTVVYICNAYNDAGEKFIQITIDARMGCINDTDNRVTTALAAGMSFSTIGLFGVLLYALSLRRILAKATHHEKDMCNSVAYSTMSLSNDNDS